jgi:hypothetical protein
MFHQFRVIEEPEIGRAEFSAQTRQPFSWRKKRNAAGRAAFDAEIRTVRERTVQATNVFLSVFRQNAIL